LYLDLIIFYINLILFSVINLRKFVVASVRAKEKINIFVEFVIVLYLEKCDSSSKFNFRRLECSCMYKLDMKLFLFLNAELLSKFCCSYAYKLN
jgi:hypothetical protein